MAIDVAVLRARLVADTSAYSRGLKTASGQTSGFERSSKRSFSVVKGGLLAVGAAAGYGLVKGLKTANAEFIEAKKASAQTEAVLKSTGGAANVAAGDVERLANAISLKAGIDDEAIQSGQNLLLTFTRVRNEAGKGNDVFSQATQTMTDMSVALGQDMKSSAIQVGKALNDPIKGVTALQRVGVSFTASQKEQIKALVESGDTLGAQKLILKELKTEFAGSAAAQATGAEKMKVAWENLMETLGGLFGPALEKAATGLATFIGGMQDGTGAGGSFRNVLRDIGDVAATVGGALATAFNAAKGGVQTALGAITGLVNKNKGDIQSFGNAVSNVAKAVAWAFTNVTVPAFKFVYSIVQRTFPAIKTIVGGALSVIGGLVRVFAGVLTGDFGKAWSGVKGIFSGGVKVILGVLRAATAPFRQLAATIGGAILSPFRSAWNTVKSVFSSGARAALSVIKAATAPQRAAAKGVGDAVVSAYGTVSNIVGKARSAASSATSALKNATGAARSAAGAVADAIVGGFVGLGARLANMVRNALQSALDAIKSAPGKVKNLLGLRIAAPAAGGFVAPPSGFQKLTAAGKKKPPKPTGPPPFSLAGARGTGFDTARGGAEVGIGLAGGTGGAEFGTAKERGVDDDIAAMKKLLAIVDSRILKLRKTEIPKAIKGTKTKNKTKAKKARDTLLRLVGELSGLVNERNSLAAAIAELGVTTTAPATEGIDTGGEATPDTPPPADPEPAPEPAAEPADTSPTPDQSALLAQAEARAAVAAERARISEAGLGVLQGGGDIGYGRPFIVINTLHPGDPKTLDAIGKAATGGFGLQGSMVSPRAPVTA